MNKKTEKKRCSNFSSFEIEFLIKLVEERRQILRCPKLDAATVERRNAAWREITEIFNNHEAVTVFRDEEKLKKKYSNIRCERNKVVKLKNTPSKSDEGSQSNDLAQDNDNAVNEIVKSVNAEESASQQDVVEPKELPKEEPEETQNVNEELTADEYSDNELTDCSSISDDSDEEVDEEYKLPLKLNEEEKFVQNAANNFAEAKSNMAMDKSMLELEIIAIEHKERMKYMKLKHANQLKRLEYQKLKHHLELELLNVEIAVKRKKLKKIDNLVF